jgi:hypothetical protein
MDPEFSVSDLMSTAIRAEHVAYGPRFVFLGGDVLSEDLDGVIMAIDRKGGEVFRLLAEPDHELAPLGATQEMLAVHARRTRGSERNEIWGVEVESGATLWKRELDVEKRYQVDTYSSPLWDAFLSPHGLVLLQVFPEDGRIQIQRLDIENGEILAESEIKIGGNTFFIREAIWTNAAAYFAIDGDLYALDYESATLDKDWP